MAYRVFRRLGKVLDRIDKYGEGASISPDDVAVDEVAAALGADPADITVEHVDTAPVVEEVIPPTPVVADPDIEAIVTILTKADADITAAEVKQLILRFLRRRRREGRI